MPLVAVTSSRVALPRLWKIKQAVAVVIKPQSGSAEALMSEEAAGTRGVHKSSFAGVAKEPALADASDEDVGEAIVVVIADGHAHSVELDIEARAARYVGECAVAIVAVKPKSGTLSFVAWPVHSVDQKDVLPAVVVVVEECAARAQGLCAQLAAIRAAASRCRPHL